MLKDKRHMVNELQASDTRVYAPIPGHLVEWFTAQLHREYLERQRIYKHLKRSLA
jgi:hypothetical protein